MKNLSSSSVKLLRGSVVTVLMLGLIGVQPWLWGLVRSRAEQLRNRQTQTDQLANVEKQIAETQEAYAADEAFMAQLELPFPRENTTPQIIERLEQLAGTRGVTVQIDSIVEQASQLRRGKVLIPLTVNVRAFGSARSLLEYFEAVEHTQEFVKAESWKVSPEGAGQSATVGTLPTRYVLTGQLRYYLQPDGNGSK